MGSYIVKNGKIIYVDDSKINEPGKLYGSVFDAEVSTGLKFIPAPEKPPTLEEENTLNKLYDKETLKIMNHKTLLRNIAIPVKRFWFRLQVKQNNKIIFKGYVVTSGIPSMMKKFSKDPSFSYRFKDGERGSCEITDRIFNLSYVQLNEAEIRNLPFYEVKLIATKA